MPADGELRFVDLFRETVHNQVGSLPQRPCVRDGIWNALLAGFFIGGGTYFVKGNFRSARSGFLASSLLAFAATTSICVMMGQKEKN